MKNMNTWNKFILIGLLAVSIGLAMTTEASRVFDILNMSLPSSLPSSLPTSLPASLPSSLPSSAPSSTAGNPGAQIILELSPNQASLDVDETLVYTVILRTDGRFSDGSGNITVDVDAYIDFDMNYVEVLDISFHEEMTSTLAGSSHGYSNDFGTADLSLDIRHAGTGENDINIGYVQIKATQEITDTNLIFAQADGRYSDVTKDGVSHLDRFQNANLAIGGLTVQVGYNAESQPGAFQLPARPGICSYQIYRSTTPYFIPDSGTLFATMNPGETFVDNSGIGDPDINYIYVFRAEICSSGNYIESNGYAEFDYALITD